jgi:hypothetical protein
VIEQRGNGNCEAGGARLHTADGDPARGRVGPESVTLYVRRERQVAGLGLETEDACQLQR